MYDHESGSETSTSADEGFEDRRAENGVVGAKTMESEREREMEILWEQIEMEEEELSGVVMERLNVRRPGLRRERARLGRC